MAIPCHSFRPFANLHHGFRGHKDPQDLIIRGRYNPTPFGRAVFLVLRAIDPVIQYFILSRHAGLSWIPQWLGGALLSPTGTTSTRASINTNFLGLAPYQSLILSMSIGSMLKQNFWLVAVSQDEMPASSAVIISLFNTIMNGINALLATWTLTSVNPSAPTPAELLKSPYVSAGLILYGTGILIETISEVQRSRFKKDPRNKGKPHAGGLFGLARNINYGGYTLWRMGFATAAAGSAWGLVVGCWFFYDFTHRAIPILDRYCTKKVSNNPANPNHQMYGKQADLECSMEQTGRTLSGMYPTSSFQAFTRVTSRQGS